MTAESKHELHCISDRIVRAASNGAGDELASLLDQQKEFVRIHAHEMDENTLADLFTDLNHAMRSAKVRRALILDTIASNQRSLGVLHGYLAAQES